MVLFKRSDAITQTLEKAAQVLKRENIEDDEWNQKIISYSKNDNIGIPYRVVKCAVELLKSHDPDHATNFHTLLKTTTLYHPPPLPKKKNPKLEAHLNAIRKRQEDEEYGRMVGKKSRSIRDVEDPFSNYKSVIGSGVEIFFAMFGLALVGYMLAQFYTDQEDKRMIWAGIGLTIGFVVEMILFLMRMTMVDLQHYKQGKSKFRQMEGMVVPNSYDNISSDATTNKSLKKKLE